MKDINLKYIGELGRIWHEKYLKMIKHTGHDRFWKEVEEGKWEPETFDVLRHYCTPDSTFIDIGAWNGVCSIYAALLGCKVIAAEPDAEALKYLHKNIELNGVEVTVHPVCVSDTTGTVRLKTQYENGFGNSMSSILDRNSVADSVEVPSVTLEEFLSGINNIGLIKIDVEGAEVKILKQSKEYLSRHRHTVYVSLHPFWFDSDKDIEDIREAVYGTYTVLGVGHGTILEHEFVELVKRGVHSLLLIAR